MRVQAKDATEATLNAEDRFATELDLTGDYTVINFYAFPEK